MRELSGPATVEAVEVVIGAGRLDLGVAAEGAPTHRGELSVSQARWPFLADHVVKGNAVVPIALVVEWLLAAAALARPKATVNAVRDLQVMKPVMLALDTNERAVVELACFERGEDELEVRLVDGKTRVVRYQARVAFGGPPDLEPTLKVATSEPTYRTFGYEAADAYDGRLFHGPDFQVIAELGGWSKTSATLTLRNRPLTGAAWRLGPAALDGAIQAAALWTLECFGKSSLPLRIAELTFSRPLTDGEHCQCRLVGEDNGGLGTRSDVECIAADGTVVLALRGVECFHVDSYWAPVAT